MPDIYRNFDHLARHEIEGTDFQIEWAVRDPKMLILAPHGGKIEPFTTPLTKRIAGTDLSYYAFNGIKPENNRHLHLASHCFDEPKAVSLVRQADRVVTIHGQKNTRDAFVMIGGLAETLATSLALSLASAHFDVRAPKPQARGRHPRNICNRSRLKQGVQIELSAALRNLLKNDRLQREHFVAAMRRPLIEHGASGCPGS